MLIKCISVCKAHFCWSLNIYPFKWLQIIDTDKREPKAYLHRYWNISKENATHCQDRQHNQRKTEWNPIFFPKPLGPLCPPSLPLQGFHLELPRLWWATYHLGCQRDTALRWFSCLPSQIVVYSFPPTRVAFVCLVCFPQRTQRTEVSNRTNGKSEKRRSKIKKNVSVSA